MLYKIIKNLIKSSGAGDGNNQPIHRKEAKTESESGQKPSGGLLQGKVFRLYVGRLR